MSAPAQQTSGKNLVLCFDGTGDWAGDHQTNVYLHFQRLECSARQIIFYEGGVGTLSDSAAMAWWKRTWLRFADLAFAIGLREKIINGYTFLVENYEPGDQIYLFGFSRGAFSARLLASMIYNFGILRQEQKNLIPYLWQTISSIGSYKKFTDAARLIKQDLAVKNISPADPNGDEGVSIHFMGLYDTVSSVGILERFKTFPFTEKNPALRTVRHAVSINEQRNAFPEMLFQLDADDERFKKCDVVEVWFPGVHRDIGGGYVTNNGLPTTVLEWITDEAKLHEKPGLPPIQANGGKKVQLGIFDWYVVLGLYPMRIWDHNVEGFRQFWPNIIHSRNIPQNALVHESAILPPAPTPSAIADYHPINLPKNPKPFPGTPPPDHYEFETDLAIFPEVVGITLGVLLVSLFSYYVATGNYGLWNTHPVDDKLVGGILAGALALYIVSLGFWQRVAGKLPADPNSIMPTIGAAICVAGGIFGRSWHVLLYALAAGFLLSALCLLPRKLPDLTAVRAIPLLAVPMLVVSLAIRGACELFHYPITQDALVASDVFSVLVGWAAIRILIDRFTTAQKSRRPDFFRAAMLGSQCIFEVLVVMTAACTAHRFSPSPPSLQQVLTDNRLAEIGLLIFLIILLLITYCWADTLQVREQKIDFSDDAQVKRYEAYKAQIENLSGRLKQANLSFVLGLAVSALAFSLRGSGQIASACFLLSIALYFLFFCWWFLFLRPRLS